MDYVGYVVTALFLLFCILCVYRLDKIEQAERSVLRIANSGVFLKEELVQKLLDSDDVALKALFNDFILRVAFHLTWSFPETAIEKAFLLIDRLYRSGDLTIKKEYLSSKELEVRRHQYEHLNPDLKVRYSNFLIVAHETDKKREQYRSERMNFLESIEGNVALEEDLSGGEEKILVELVTRNRKPL